MLTNRVIPILLIKDGGLVKTQEFENPKYVGDPINVVRIFNEKEVDEIAILDISATACGRGPNFELVSDVASECFMPLAYGGGVRSSTDARKLFSIGVEKVILRSASMNDLTVVREVADTAGSSSVAISVDLKRSKLGRYRLYAPGTRLHGNEAWESYISDAVAAGAGEVLLNAVERDGTMNGMDLALIRRASTLTSVPLVAVGGVGSLQHIREAVLSGADAVGAGAFFVYHGARRAVLITYPKYEELTELLGRK